MEVKRERKRLRCKKESVAWKNVNDPDTRTCKQLSIKLEKGEFPETRNYAEGAK